MQIHLIGVPLFAVEKSERMRAFIIRNLLIALVAFLILPFWSGPFALAQEEALRISGKGSGRDLRDQVSAFLFFGVSLRATVS